MKVIPYLIFNGNCEEALNFYTKALGGNLGHMSRYSDVPPEQNQMNMASDKIMHTQFMKDGEVLLMASDGPTTDTDSGMVSLSLDYKDPGGMENAFAQLSDGGSVTMPLQDTFWNARFGMLTDKYGVKWMFNHDIKK